MWTFFCPNVHGKCEDGHPEAGELPCCFWDSLDEVCLFVEGMRKNYDSFKQAQRIIDEKGTAKLGKKYSIKDILAGIEKKAERGVVEDGHTG
jgi:hypothetical protein